MTKNALADFPYFKLFAESHYDRSTDSHAKTSLETRVARHPNTESRTPVPPKERRRAHPRVPDRARSRAADQGLRGQSLAASRPDHDPAGIPAWLAGFRGLRPAMDPGRFRGRNARGHPGKARHAVNSPADRPGAAGTAPPAPRGRRPIAVPVRVRTRLADDGQQLPEAYQPGLRGRQAQNQGSPAHAAACLRVPPSECRTGYSIAAEIGRA